MSDVLILSTPSVSLAFGLDWLPLINGGANRVVYRMARQYRATHLVYAGDTAAAVGLAILKLNRAQRKRMLTSAAQNVARLFASGTIALLLELDCTNYWLVAVHEGAVVARTDTLYRSHAEADAALDELRHAYPQLAVLGASGAPEPPGLAEIEAASIAQTQLMPLNRWRSVLPAPVQWFVLSLLIATLAPRVWQILGPAKKAVAASSPLDPVQAWQSAIAGAARHRIVHGVAGTRLLLHSLYQLPTHLAGWSMARATCTAQQSIWQCQALYDRLHRDASNDGFLGGAPGNWSIEFLSMDRAQPAWQVQSAGVALAGHRVKNSAYNERHLFSSLQTIKPAFKQIQFGRSKALAVTPPRDQRGKAIPMPDGLSPYLTRSVHISGPLRSGSSLLPYTDSIGWQKISVFLRDTEAPGLKNSRVNVSFEGVLYEIKTGGTNDDVGPLGSPDGLR